MNSKTVLTLAPFVGVAIGLIWAGSMSYAAIGAAIARALYTDLSLPSLAAAGIRIRKGKSAMMKAKTDHPARLWRNARGGNAPTRGLRPAKILPAILLILALLVAACQGLDASPFTPAVTDQGERQAQEPARAADETDEAAETEETPTVLDLDSDVLDMDATLPLHDLIRKVQLDNGLTYYVRRNTEPANRATLMLVVNAGSVQEDEDQLGLAHFLEHMMFNGTERFPKQELAAYFESVGMTFGPDVNAYTSFNETVYFLEFPTDDEEIISKSFQVAEDWASRATISEEEVELERGVIVEEERLRAQNAAGRIGKRIFRFLLGGSRYAERDPIGDMEIVRNAPAAALRRFYEEWYRPDLMAVIVVGDLDMDATEARIVEHFGGLSNPDGARARGEYTLPEFDDTRYLIITDPEFPMTLSQIIYRQAAEELHTAGVYRDLQLGRLFYRMLNFRLNDIAREADSPFLGAAVNEGQLVRGVYSQVVDVQARQGEVASGLDAALTEVERARRHGFTAAELDRAKSELLNDYLRLYNDRDNLDSHSLAREYSRNFLANESVPGIEFEYRLVERLLPGISLEDVNRKAEQYGDGGNRSVMIIGPEPEADTLPTEEELAAVIDGLRAKQVDDYKDIEAVSELLTKIPEPVEVVSLATDATYNITDLTLANGARVLLKPTDFKEEEVLFSASSPGGSSLVSDEDYPEANFIHSIVSQSALGDVGYAALQRLLADRSVGVSPYIGELDEGFYGHSDKEHVETLFQLVYLYGTAANADDDAFATLKDQYTESLRNRELDPFAALMDALIAARHGDSARRNVPTLEIIDSLDLERAFEIYQERFADFSDFTFVFVGNFDVERMVDWSRRYLGNLPSTGREETWVDVAPDPPTGVVVAPVYRGQEEQSVTSMLFTGPAQDSLETRLTLRMLATVLDTLMRENLREERGGVYAYGVSAKTVPEPDSLFEVSVYFGSDPGRVEELVDALFALIAGLRNDGPREDLLDAAKAQYVRQREEQLEQNGFWLHAIERYAGEEGVELAAFVDMAVVEERTQAVTAADIKAAALEYLRVDRYIQVTLYPEDFER
ncbi:MAG: insulinase family protein [Caldilineaceae bacterium]|nr:insulinase family protein [Caldilineaceae bacterium]